MVLNDAETSPSDRAENAQQSTPSAAESPLGGTWRLLALALIAALLAGVASLLAGEMILKSYISDLNPEVQNNPSAESVRRLKDARIYSATFTFTALGGLLGLAMGLAGGLARRSVLVGVKAAFLGAVLGSTVAASISRFLLPIFFQRYDPQLGSLVLPLLTHGAIWSAVGGVGGLAFGLGLGARGRWNAALVGGLTGAAAATVIYEIVGALAFASSKTDLPLSSSSTTRGMALLLVASLSAIGAVMALRQPAKQATRSSALS
jgi:hypothetical protein